MLKNLNIPHHRRISLLIRASVGQALAADTTNGVDDSLRVVRAKGSAMVIAEAEFGQVTVQVFRADMLVDTTNTAL